MLALLPLIFQLAPTIANWIGGSRAEAVVGQVAAAVTAVTGVADPHTDAGAVAVQAALQGKPELAAALQQRLAEITSAQHRADQDAQTERFKAAIADTVSARQATTDLTKAGSAIAWGAPLVSLTVLATFGLVMGATLTRSLPAGSETILNMLLGTLGAMATSVVSYWVGSSAGSAQKTDLMARNQAPSGPLAR